jgi:hypothetical protein
VEKGKAPDGSFPEAFVVKVSNAACLGLGGKAGLIAVPRISASAVCSALSSFASLGM